LRTTTPEALQANFVPATNSGHEMGWHHPQEREQGPLEAAAEWTSQGGREEVLLNVVKPVLQP